jgi:hypothetical protein
LSNGTGCSRETASLFGREIVKLTGGVGEPRVLLVGPEHIELLVELLNRGFVDVSCRNLAGPNAGELSADIIIAPEIGSEPELVKGGRSLQRALRPGGILLVGIPSSTSTLRDRLLRKLLREAGFALVRTQLPSTAIDVLCCRRVGAVERQTAA